MWSRVTWSPLSPFWGDYGTLFKGCRIIKVQQQAQQDNKQNQDNNGII